MSRTLMRGAIPTPRHKLAGATPFRRVDTPPPEVAVIPTHLSMWGNDVYGDCVTAEEAYAKAASTVMAGLPELYIPTQTVESWASANGVLNGAGLTQVMDMMAQSGFAIGGTTYDDGPYSAVDYSVEADLQAAIACGPVKIGIDASALPSGAGNVQGWYATGGTPGQYTNEDHCVSLTGYGTAASLYAALGVALPTGLSPTDTGYLLYTWSTIGFVDHAWIMSTCGEAWLRQPTTTPMPPGPSPTPTPSPSPSPTPTPSPSPAPTPSPTPCQHPSAADLVRLSAQLAALRPGTRDIGTIPWATIIAILQAILAALTPILGEREAAAQGSDMQRIMCMIADLSAAIGAADKVLHQLATCCPRR